jgi:predicted TIM-barrel fold metal-dependent hydrolase
MELDVPFLLHTGIGDQDIILNKCNPACLWNMLVNEELRHAKIVLVHAGYPFLSEAAFLTSVLPNVYLDLSVLIPLGQTNPHRLAQILETAPLTKVMYASDVHLPEMYWLSAKIGKSMLSQALSQIVNVGVLTEDEAHKAAQRILKDNAKEFYKL